MVRYVAQEDPVAAERIGHSLIDRVLILEQFPFLGPLFPARTGVRTLSSPPYVIFYRIEEQERCIQVLRYWHGARGEADLPASD